MFTKATFLATLSLASAFIQLVAAQEISEKCQTCMPNLAYCINLESYYICPDTKNPSRNTIHTCKEGEVCTTGPNICVESAAVAAPITIPCSSSCGTCPTDTTKKLTCVGKTQYKLCSGSQTTSILGTCNNDEICSMESYLSGEKICIPNCVAEYFGYKPTCTSDELTTTTTTKAPTPAPNPTSLRQQCQNARVSHPNALFYYTSNTDDTSCKTYLYCEPGANSMEAIRITCKTGYYDASTGKCVTIRPAGCTV